MRAFFSSMMALLMVPLCILAVVALLSGGAPRLWHIEEALHPVPGTDFVHPTGEEFSFGYKSTGHYILSVLGAAGWIDGPVLVPKNNRHIYIPLDPLRIAAFQQRGYLPDPLPIPPRIVLEVWAETHTFWFIATFASIVGLWYRKRRRIYA